MRSGFDNQSHCRMNVEASASIRGCGTVCHELMKVGAFTGLTAPSVPCVPRLTLRSPSWAAAGSPADHDRERWAFQAGPGWPESPTARGTPPRTAADKDLRRRRWQWSRGHGGRWSPRPLGLEPGRPGVLHSSSVIFRGGVGSSYPTTAGPEPVYLVGRIRPRFSRGIYTRFPVMLTASEFLAAFFRDMPLSPCAAGVQSRPGEDRPSRRSP